MIVLACQAHARPSHFLCENFADLTGWNDMYFKNVRYHTLYTIAKNGDKTCLRAESFRSASGLILKTSFNVYEYSKLKWRWKVENVYAKGDHKTKEGDDYPMRIYVVFKDEGFLNSIGSAFSADSLSGKTLIYIWDNKETTEKIVTSPHYSKSKMIIKESGSSRLGQWIDEEANITEDYNAAFGKYPPETASIAIMNDADDTQEASTSYLDLLEVYRD
jgi:hypothetical protein